MKLTRKNSDTSAKIREKLRFVMELKGGVIQQNNWALMTLTKFEDQKVIVTIESVSSKRSLNQNSYLWGVVYPKIASHTGHSVNELHSIFKRTHLPPRIIMWRGREFKIVNSISRLSKGEMAEFITRIIAEASEMGITVPPADPSKSTTRLDV